MEAESLASLKFKARLKAELKAELKEELRMELKKESEIYTRRDIRRWMTEEDHEPSSDGRYNQELYQTKLSKTIENPEEVLDGKDIHHGQTECKV